jgi:iron complex outermembrane receptor protein
MRPTPLPQRFTPRPLALAAAITIALAAGLAPPAHAQGGAAAAAATPMAIDIPAQPLGQALNALARQANLQMTFSPALVAGKQAPAVRGNLTAGQALDRMLAGSGLAASVSGTSVVVREAPTQRAGETTLPAVRVVAGAGGPTAPTARGNLAGTEFVSPVVRAGILGDRPTVEVPFTIHSYTKDVIEAQQARTLWDVLRTDASARNFDQAGGPATTVTIRGFETYGGAWDGLNGGFANAYQDFPLEFVDSVEVMKGPSALLFGSGNQYGSPAGSINYIPKRAPAGGEVRRVIVGTQTGGLLSASADMGGRFGSDQQFGYRLNVLGKKGGLAVDNVELDEKGFLGSFEWRATRDLTLTADFGKIDSNKKGYTDMYGLATGVALPRAPDGRINASMPWADWNADREFALLKADWSINPDWKLTLATTRAQSSFEYLSAGFISIADIHGNGTLFTGVANPFTVDTATHQATLTGKLKTGAVSHQLAFSLTRDTDKQTYTPSADYGSFPTNIYRPIHVPRPVPTLTGAAPITYTDLTADSIRLLNTMTWGPWVAIAGIGRITFDEAIPDAAGNPYRMSKTTPMGALLYRLGASSSVYASYAEGLERGGTAPATAANAFQAMPPRESSQIEVGYKVDFGSAQMAAALFRIDRALEYVNPATNLYVQDGLQRHTGLELSASGQVTPDLNIIASALLIRPTVANDTVSGNRATGVPERSLSLYANWRVPAYRPLTLSAGMQYKSAQWLDLANTQRIDAFTVFDLGATLDMQAAWGTPGRLRLAINNVTDKAYWSTVSFGGLGIGKGEPRTVKLSARFDF